MSARADGRHGSARRVVFFECLTPKDRLWLTGYLAQRQTVYYQNRRGAFQPKAQPPVGAVGDGVRPLRLDPPLYRWTNGSYDEAFDRTEAIYDRDYATNRLIQRIQRLLQHDAIHLAFRKVLVGRLSECFYYRALIRRVREQCVGARHVDVILWSPRHVYQQQAFARAMGPEAEAPKPLPSWGFPRWTRVGGFVAGWQERLEAVWMILRVLGRCVVSQVRRRRGREPRAYRLGVAIISELRELRGGLRSAGFLADGAHIRNEEALLVPVNASVPPAHVARLKAEGFGVCEPLLPVPWKIAGDAAGVCWAIARSLFRQPPWVLVTAAQMVREYVMWQTFATYYRVGKFVTCADYGIGHIPRNVILGQHGSRAWYYLDSGNLPEAMPLLDRRSLRFDWWGYLYYDVMVCWGERFSRYFRLHPQRVARYVSVGCLWSEHVRLLKEGVIQSTVRAQLQARGWKPGQKVVTVYPIWYHVNSIAHPDDGLAFLDGIRRLMTDLPDVFIILKEKHQRWLFTNRHDVGRQDYGGEALAIYRAYESLDHEARCWLPGSTADSSELTAASDLVISFPFTSAAIEAMCAGVPALYFDPRERFRGGYYDSMPGLMAYSYAALRERTITLLYETSAGEYRRYLEAYVLGDTDPYLDGRAITRLRELLAAAEPGQLQVAAAEHAGRRPQALGDLRRGVRPVGCREAIGA